MALVVFTILKAILTRLLFAVHSLLTIWRVVDVYEDRKYWLSLSALVLLLVETLFTLIRRQGQEWKWFCPSFFLYLLGVVPGIWFLELDRLERYRMSLNGTDANITGEKLSAIQGFEIPVYMEPDMWVNTIEQTMLLLLIIGRWLLPKGDITRDQLSQLLFVYIGMTSDIMELYVLFQEPVILEEDIIKYVILSVWSLSLLQFCLVLTATKARKPRGAHESHSDTPNSSRGGCCGCAGEDCCASEVWSILIMVGLQDAPFLTVRLYVTLTYRLLTYNILFFTAKNALIIMLQFYRLMVVCIHLHKRFKLERKQSQKRREERNRYIGNRSKSYSSQNHRTSQSQPMNSKNVSPRHHAQVENSKVPRVKILRAIPVNP